MSGQQRNVTVRFYSGGSRFGKGSDGSRDLAKAARFHFPFRVPVGGGNQPNIDSAGYVFVHAFELSLLQDP
jgi:hypothetical protein